MEQEAKEIKEAKEGNTQSITKDMTIGDAVSKYPACIEVLQAAGVHCVGCHVSYLETLEQGFKGHGMSDGEIDEVVSKLNVAVEGSKLEEGKEFIVTDKASEKLKEVLKENNKEGSGLRVEIVPGGCSGFRSEGSKLEEGKEFIVTDKASEKLKEVLKENNKEGSGLRVEIVPGGCSGF